MADLTAHSFSPSTTGSEKQFSSELMIRRFVGVVFSISAFGLWLAPGTSDTADALLLKTGLTVILAFCAIAALVPRR